MADSVTTSLGEGEAVIDWRRDDSWLTLESLLGLSSGTYRDSLSIVDAYRIDAVIACLDVISRDLAKVDLQMVEKLDNGGHRIMKPEEHWLAGLLALDPNHEHSWRDFVGMLAIHTSLVSNSFIFPVRSGRNQEVTELIPIIPTRVQIMFTPDTGEKVYLISRSNMYEQAMMKEVPFYVFGNELIHVRKRVFDGLNGLSTLTIGGPTFGLAKAVRDYQRRLFDNDGQNRLYFQQAGDLKPLSDDSYNRMKTELRGAASRMLRDNVPMLLEPGYTANMVGQTSADAKVDEASVQALVAVARIFGVPPHKIGHAGEAKYQNMEVFERLYAQDVLVPLAQTIESPMERSLLTREERGKYGLRFNREQMEVVDFKVRAEVMKVFMDRMAVTVDEMRSSIGLNPLPDGLGNVRLVQSTMNVIGEDGEILIPAGSQGSGDTTTDSPEDTTDEAKSAEVHHLRTVK